MTACDIRGSLTRTIIDAPVADSPPEDHRCRSCLEPEHEGVGDDADHAYLRVPFVDALERRPERVVEAPELPHHSFRDYRNGSARVHFGRGVVRPRHGPKTGGLE